MLKVRDSASKMKVSVGDSAIECKLDNSRGRQVCLQADDPRCLRGHRPLAKSEQSGCEWTHTKSLKWESSEGGMA